MVANFEVSKNFEARKLNKRSGIPLSEAPVTIPYGGFLKDVQYNRDLARFTFLEEPYQVEQRVLEESTRPSGGASAGAPTVTPAAVSSSPRPAAAAASAAETASAPKLEWEDVASDQVHLLRAKVPGGWLVVVRASNSITFVPDSGYRW